MKFVYAVMVGFSLSVTLLACREHMAINRRLEELSILKTNVHWMGHPMFFEGDDKAGSFRWADDIEVGCRLDGIVVWKGVSFDTNAPTFKIVQPLQHP